MPALIAFMIRHFGNGFLLGTAAALAAVLLSPASMAAQVVAESLAGFSLVVFALGSSFGMGSLATALLLETGEA